MITTRQPEARTLRQSRASSIRRVAWFVMTAAAVLVFLWTARLLTFSPEFYPPARRLDYITYPYALAAHIIPAMLTLIIGPFLFLSVSRTEKYRSLHRLGGRVYLVSVLIGGLSSFFLIALADYDLLVWLAFTLVGILWLMTGWLAYRSIRRGQVRQHYEWMVRNYALTFVAVTLRFWLLMAELVGLYLYDPTTYALVVWMGWVPNLIVAELIIRYPAWAARRRVTSRERTAH